MSNEPSWLKPFVDQVCQGVEFMLPDTPLGCHVHAEGDVWEISLFAATTEVLGGPKDGEWIREPLVFNINQVLTAFDDVTGISWQAGSMSSQDDLGTHLAIHGRVSDSEIWLRLLAQSPERYSPGRILHHTSGELATSW